jgi:Protein of unknown function (DUF3024)
LQRATKNTATPHKEQPGGPPGYSPAVLSRRRFDNVAVVPIPETDLHRIKRWAADHTPPEVRDQVWVELERTNTHITVLECRPYWRPEEGQPPTRRPVARCRWNNTAKHWTLYWQRADGKFYIWPPLEPQPSIARLLTEIDDSSTGAFWG